MSKNGEKTQNKVGRYALNAKKLAYIALFSAVICVCAWIKIPFGVVPFTLQILGVCLAGGLLGWKGGLASVAVYLALGLIGVPVFSGFSGGVAAFAAQTGGYLIGFLFLAFFSGLFSDLFKTKTGIKSYILIGLGMLVGLLVCYALGVAWFAWQTVGDGGEIGAWSIITSCVLPYLPTDIIKIVVATVLTKKLYEKIKN